MNYCFFAFNLTAALATLNADNAAVAAYVKAWGLEQDPVNKAATAAQVYAATEAKEVAIDALATTAAGAAQTYNVVGETSGSGDKIEDARLIIINENVAANGKTLNTTLTDATTNMNTVSASLKAAADGYLSSLTAQETADLASVVANQNTVNVLAALNAGSTDITAVVRTSDTKVTITSATLGDVEVIYDTTAKTWSYTGGAAGAGDAGVASAAPAGIDLTGVKAAVVAELAAETAAADAATNVQLRLDSIAKISEAQFTSEKYYVSAVSGGTTYYATSNAADADKLVLAADGGSAANAAAITAEIAANWTTTAGVANQLSKADAATVDVTNSTLIATTVTYAAGTALKADFEATNGVADLYIGAAAAVTAYDKAVAKLNAGVDAVTAARATTTELTALEKAVTDATKVLTDEGYAVSSLSDTAFVNGTAKIDVFNLGTLTKDNQAATINDFGFVGDDMLYIGSGYTFNAGKVATDGNDAVLEMFAAQSGANVVLTFETVPYGSNTAPGGVANPEAFTVTLTGVALADLHVSNGFVTLA